MTRILIAEDEDDIRDLIIFTLQFEGYEVIATRNGAEAVERAPAIMPDMIMLDVRMPRMTGYEACRILKADKRTEHIPVLFLSAKGQEVEVEEGMSAGAVGYMLKPFDMPALLDKLKSILAEQKKKATAPLPAEVKQAAPPATPSDQKPAAEVKQADKPASTEEKKPDGPASSGA